MDKIEVSVLVNNKMVETNKIGVHSLVNKIMTGRLANAAIIPHNKTRMIKTEATRIVNHQVTIAKTLTPMIPKTSIQSTIRTGAIFSATLVKESKED